MAAVRAFTGKLHSTRTAVRAIDRKRFAWFGPKYGHAYFVPNELQLQMRNNRKR